MSAPAHRPLFAIALRLSAAVLLAAMVVLVKLAGEAGATLPEILFWRQGVTIPCLFGWMALARRTELLHTRRAWVHGRRAALGLSSMSLLFGATAPQRHGPTRSRKISAASTTANSGPAKVSVVSSASGSSAVAPNSSVMLDSPSTARRP